MSIVEDPLNVAVDPLELLTLCRQLLLDLL